MGSCQLVSRSVISLRSLSPIRVSAWFSPFDFALTFPYLLLLLAFGFFGTHARRSVRRLGFANHYVAAVRTRHGALNHQRVLLGQHLKDAKVANRNAVDAHVAGGAHTLQHAGGKR